MAKITKKRIMREIQTCNAALINTHDCYFVTLTYRDGEVWESRHISNFVMNIRNYCKRDYDPKYKLPYVWVCENNEDRYYVHYHVLLWIPVQISLPKSDEQGWWPYGSTQTEIAFNPAAYLAKYLGKSLLNEPLKVPEGCTARRASINVRMIVDNTYTFLPDWLAYLVSPTDKVRYVSGWGWVNFTTKKLYNSPFYFGKNGCQFVGWTPEYRDRTKPIWSKVRRLGMDLSDLDLWMIESGMKRPDRINNLEAYQL